jgi:hypothetical protein
MALKGSGYPPARSGRSPSILAGQGASLQMHACTPHCSRPHSALMSGGSPLPPPVAAVVAPRSCRCPACQGGLGPAPAPHLPRLPSPPAQHPESGPQLSQQHPQVQRRGQGQAQRGAQGVRGSHPQRGRRQQLGPARVAWGEPGTQDVTSSCRADAGMLLRVQGGSVRAVAAQFSLYHTHM